MKPVRVLHVTRQLNYGSAIVLDQLARTLAKKNYEPILAFETHEQSNIRKNLTQSEIKTIDLKKSCDGTKYKNSKKSRRNTSHQIINNRFGTKAGDAYLALKSVYTFFLKQAPRVRQFLKLIRAYNIKLIHTHSNLSHAKPEILAAWISGIPCVAHAHAYFEPTHFERFFAKMVTSFIYISNDVADHYYNRGFPRSRSNVIHNGVDLINFPYPCLTNDVRDEFKLGSNCILVGLIGRIDWWKGHEYFIEAFAQAARCNEDLIAMIIGEPGIGWINQEYFQKIKLKINSLNLSDKIIFTGFREDVPRLMSAMDIVVHASSQPEPFGLVAIEGMACGKPVIATSAGGILDIIQDRINGILVPRKDSYAMAKALIELASDKKTAERIGKASRERIADKFTIQHQAIAVEQLYRSLLKRS